jgi:hypothetical protein
MLLLNKIRNDETLKDFIEDSCCDSGICAQFDEKIDKNDYIVFKVDKFYASQKLSETPKSIDCFIILRCQNKAEHYALYLIELKNQKGNTYKPKDTPEKFRTVERFMNEPELKNYLNRFYNKIELYLVSKIGLRDFGLESKLFINERIEINGLKKRIMPKFASETVVFPYYAN